MAVTPFGAGAMEIVKTGLEETPPEMLVVEARAMPLVFIPTMKQSLGNPMHPVQITIEPSFGMIIECTALVDRLHENVEVRYMEFDNAARAQYPICLAQGLERPVPGNVLQNMRGIHEVERLGWERQGFGSPAADMIHDAGALLTIQRRPGPGQPRGSGADFEPPDYW
jgi:hypothetical protein